MVTLTKGVVVSAGYEINDVRLVSYEYLLLVIVEAMNTVTLLRDEVSACRMIQVMRIGVMTRSVFDSREIAAVIQCDGADMIFDLFVRIAPCTIGDLFYHAPHPERQIGALVDPPWEMLDARDIALMFCSEVSICRMDRVKRECAMPH